MNNASEELGCCSEVINKCLMLHHIAINNIFKLFYLQHKWCLNIIVVYNYTTDSFNVGTISDVKLIEVNEPGVWGCAYLAWR